MFCAEEIFPVPKKRSHEHGFMCRNNDIYYNNKIKIFNDRKTTTIKNKLIVIAEIFFAQPWPLSSSE
jgi:hypothetical protein